MDAKGERVARSPSVWSALAITLLVPLGVLVLPNLGLPGVSERGDFSGTRGVGLNVFGLGVMPLISASVVVELIALVVPRWSRLRHGGPAKRAKLGRAAFFVAVLLAASQAYGVAQLSKEIAPWSGGLFATSRVVATLVAGTMLLAIVADLATRRGLVSAYATMAIAEHVSFDFTKRSHIVPQEDLATLGAVAALAVATWLVLRKAGTPSRERDGGVVSYRSKPVEPQTIAVGVPAPASGITPLIVVYWVVLSLPTASVAFAAEGLTRWLALLATLSVLAIALAFAFYGPARIAELWRRAGAQVSRSDLEGAARRGLRESIAVSILFLTFVIVVARYRVHLGGPGVVLTAVVPATAIVLDIVELIRARRQMPHLVVVWPEHRPYAIAVARQVLDAEGIPLVVTNLALRRILPFAPFAPLDLMVPAASAKRAREILERTLGADASAEGEEKPKAVSLGDRLLPAPSRGGAGKLAAMIVASIALAGASIALESPKEVAVSKRGPVSRDAIQLVAIDDDADPLEPASQTSPSMPCLDFQIENAPVGPKKFAPRHFAVCKQLGNDTSAVARDHLLSWLATVNLPKEDRFATGIEMRFDEDTETVSEAGARSYLLKREPILDANDVANAEAQVLDTPNGLTTKSAVVLIELTAPGAQRFERFTAANVGRRMAIVVEGTVSSAPIILSRIAGGHIQITMRAGSLEQQLAEAKRTEDVLMGRVHH